MHVHWCRSILCLLVLLLVAVPATAQVRLAEILSGPVSDWDGDGTVDSKLDEWLEITNTGATSVDLSDLYVRDGTGTAWHYGFSGSLPPGGTLLVTGATALQWQTENGAGSSGLSLNNSGDLVELWRAPAGGPAILVDSVEVPSHAAEADRALAWLDATGGWILHDGLNPYGGEMVPTSTGCDPSPGAANLCQAGVPVARSSVGRLKGGFED